jgi:sialate O-acetylesterase
VCSPATAGDFTAVGYFFAREIHREAAIPIGIINSSWGGTDIEVWTSPETYAAYSPEIRRTYDARRTDKLTSGAPIRNPNDRSSLLYNSMIKPIVGLAMKGVIWYQGENNADEAYAYRTLFPGMITDWRRNWGSEFPFYWVQLANINGVDRVPVESKWAELREAQTMTLSLPRTGQAVIIDIGEANDIHPRNKQDVGRRLALAALHNDYGRGEVVFSGPVYSSMSVERGRMTLDFDNGGAPLEVRNKYGYLEGFAVAGADRVFHWAQARVTRDGKVVVWNPEVREPVAVRYGWSQNPEANLYNAAGLPACPFRTDDWPGITAK